MVSFTVEKYFGKGTYHEKTIKILYDNTTDAFYYINASKSCTDRYMNVLKIKQWRKIKIPTWGTGVLEKVKVQCKDGVVKAIVK